MITLFDHLPDLPLLEILSYLSCLDALWAFSNLNARLTSLLSEQGFYYHVNLSSTRYQQFKALLSSLRFDEIQSLTIDVHASLLQIRCWPYLPRLRILKVKGVRNFRDVFSFAHRHASTLSHLTVESSRYFKTDGLSRRLCYPSWNLYKFISEILNNMFALRSLNLGMESSFFLHTWSFKTIQLPLTHLTVALHFICDLINLMLTDPLSHTLEQLHITLARNCDIESSMDAVSHLSRMKTLHTFTFAKSFEWQSNYEWSFIDRLTSAKVMPALRRMSFALVINYIDLIEMENSALFTDFRHIDVHYSFIIVAPSRESHAVLLNHVPRGSQSHPREIVSVTFMSGPWPDDQPFITPDVRYIETPKFRQHLFYTLPWVFDKFFQLCVPDRCISEVEVFMSPTMGKNYSSRLTKLDMSDNLPSCSTLLSNVIFPNKIVELQLFRCNRHVSMNLPNVSHLNLIDSLDSLRSNSLPFNVRTIQIVLHHECLHFATDDWTILRALSTLPLLKSLRILLYDMRIPPDHTSSQIIAERALLLSDFSFCFRRDKYPDPYDKISAYKRHWLFIKQLRKRILLASLEREPYISVEKDGCGLVAWF
ncbi:unnamed protein product [Adineta ricciae]|uniref:F-box domain-containing protein n=1 Tax=Adineta ricciae TaxID=249248 RepID=A0A815BMX0_ADIRI|nr:unnamed protein product [Adineta ricciae]